MSSLSIGMDNAGCIVDCVMVQSAVLDRAAVVRRGQRLEYFTVAWNAVEGLVAVGAGLFADSISLIGFGIDSFVISR